MSSLLIVVRHGAHPELIAAASRPRVAGMATALYCTSYR